MANLCTYMHLLVFIYLIVLPPQKYKTPQQKTALTYQLDASFYWFLFVSICHSLIPALSFLNNFFSSSLLSPLIISVPNLSSFTNLITEWGHFLFNIPFKLLRGLIPPVSRVALNSSWRFSILRQCSLSKISVLFIIIFRESNLESLFRHIEACAPPMWLPLFPRAIAIDPPVLWHEQGMHRRHRPVVIYPEERG